MMKFVTMARFRFTTEVAANHFTKDIDDVGLQVAMLERNNNIVTTIFPNQNGQLLSVLCNLAIDRDSQSDMCFFLQAENQLIYSNAIPAIVKIDDCLHVPMSATTAISIGSDNGLNLPIPIWQAMHKYLIAHCEKAPNNFVFSDDYIEMVENIFTLYNQ